ncbi:MAG: FtsW/RodA/SpoVE family cell cycle protein [Bacillota bacterium]|nr:FtsW/RodA/SpoVE family cell cycle protein [Bacillota bacterium]
MDLSSQFSPIMAAIAGLVDAHPWIGTWYTFGVRWVLAFLAVFILLKSIRSLLQVESPSEIWAYLGFPNGSNEALTHWENILGRAASSDVVINFPSVSRNHGTLVRDAEGNWTYNDLGSKVGSKVNGVEVAGPTPVQIGDTLTLGGVDFMLLPVTVKEKRINVKRRFRLGRPVSPWSSLIALTVFQVMTALQLIIALGEECPISVPLSILGLAAVEWFYFLALRAFRRVGFEMETIAFFLSTLSLAVTASSNPDAVFKQLVAILLGIGLFLVLCWYLRDLDRAKKIRWPLIILSVILLLINIVFGTTKYGAQNWVSFGGFSIQPSEVVKLFFIFAGAATLDELFQKGNLTVFILFSGFCFGCLAIMGDFGTAAIFFITFLVISFLRSGDFSKLVLVIGAAVFGGMMILRFKPYIANRFAAWGHVWEYASTTGYQQTRTMCASASGGLVGVGGGNGWLQNVAAADTDLVFGILNEEWGLIIAILAVLCIVTLAVFAVKSIVAGRSAFYTIAACAATSMLLFQTILNVFGSVDILPLTGVTFPFVSNGGTSMMVSWGMLAYLKAADTRQNASFAIKLPSKRELGGKKI